MICGKLSEWQRDKSLYPAAFDKALSFLAGADWATITAGRHDIDGDKIYALAQDLTSEPAARRNFEAHAKYLDIQVVLQGEEEHWYNLARPANPPIEDRLAADDIAFYPPQPGAQRLTLEQGEYVIYAPGEQHKPACLVNEAKPLKKIVFKLDYALLAGK